MSETSQLLRHFNPHQAEAWIAPLCGQKAVFLTGEGSSRIFPAHNLIAKASQRGRLDWRFHTEGARQAGEYNLQGCAVVGASNSGQTRELIDLFTRLRRESIPCYGVTATPGSKLIELADHSIILSCGKEGAVAATKSVVEQALIYQSLLQGDEWKNKDHAADLFDKVPDLEIPAGMIDIIAKATCVYFSGRNDGVAEELALKANEIARKKSIYLEGTYALHGIEEVMEASEVLVLIEPFRSEIEKVQSVICGGAGVKVMAISSFETPFPTILLPRMEGFDSYLQLLAGWNLLLSVGLACGVDVDKPLRARKVGNAF